MRDALGADGEMLLQPAEVARPAVSAAFCEPLLQQVVGAVVAVTHDEHEPRLGIKRREARKVVQHAGQVWCAVARDPGEDRAAPL